MLVPMMLSVASATAVSYSYRTKASSTANASSYTFSSLDINSAAADRHVHVAVHYGDSSSLPSITSVTIGGITAVANKTSTGSPASLVAIYTAAVPTGTTANVVLTLSGSPDQAGVGVWVSYGLSSTAAYATGNSTADPATATIATVNGGFCIAAITHTISSAQTVTWTNVTERYDDTIESNAKLFSAADAATTGANISPSGDMSGSGGVVGVFVSFG